MKREEDVELLIPLIIERRCCSNRHSDTKLERKERRRGDGGRAKKLSLIPFRFRRWESAFCDEKGGGHGTTDTPNDREEILF